MLLLIDNYDSFTFNLVHLIGMAQPGIDVEVVRNDKITVEAARAMNPEYLVISPGPCTPTEGGVSNDLIAALGPTVPTLGVCLGHQCMAHVHGGIVERADRLMHGKTDAIHHNGSALFTGIPSPFTAMRYHSLIVRRGSLPDDWLVDAWTDQDEVMALRHATHPIFGVQFHPESFMTEHGDRLIKNFLAVSPAAAVA
ncbi:MAG: aminodeoxychorismate/anthranilate synthase component II [Planctomycetota bacterium]